MVKLVINVEDVEEYKSPTRHLISRDGEEPKSKFIKSSTSTIKSVLRPQLISEDVLEILKNWNNPFEKFALTVSAPILGLASGATGFFINRHFRDILYLVNSGRISSYFIMVVFPTLTSTLTHHIKITDRIFSNQEKCPVCTQVGSAITQLFTGVMYPSIIVPLISYPIASRQKYYNLPKLSMAKPLEIVVFTHELFKPIIPKIVYIAAFQIVLSMGITYFEQNIYYSKILPESKLLASARGHKVTYDMASDI